MTLIKQWKKLNDSQQHPGRHPQSVAHDALGEKDAFSILLADSGTKSWVYVTAPGTDDALMQEASRLITTERTATGTSKSFKGDIAKRAQEVLEDPAHSSRAVGR